MCFDNNLIVWSLEIYNHQLENLEITENYLILLTDPTLAIIIELV